MKVLLTAAVLALSPIAAVAQCAFGHETMAQSCVDGYTWDPAKSSCVEIVTG